MAVKSTTCKVSALRKAQALQLPFLGLTHAQRPLSLYILDGRLATLLAHHVQHPRAVAGLFASSIANEKAFYSFIHRVALHFDAFCWTGDGSHGLRLQACRLLSDAPIWPVTTEQPRMHVWKPVNKVWALAPSKADRGAEPSLKRGAVRIAHSSEGHKDGVFERSRALSVRSNDAVAKRQRTSEAPPEAAQGSSVPSHRAPSASTADADPASGPAPASSDAAQPDAGRADACMASRVEEPAPGSSGTAPADAGAVRGSRGGPPASSAAQALRVAVAAGERETERYTGFELVEELTEEQLAEAADELYEPLPTCPICAHTIAAGLCASLGLILPSNLRTILCRLPVALTPAPCKTMALLQPSCSAALVICVMHAPRS